MTNAMRLIKNCVHEVLVYLLLKSGLVEECIGHLQVLMQNDEILSECHVCFTKCMKLCVCVCDGHFFSNLPTCVL